MNLVKFLRCGRGHAAVGGQWRIGVGQRGDGGEESVQRRVGDGRKAEKWKYLF